MTTTTEDNGALHLRLDDHPLCRMKSSSGSHCNAMPFYYVRSGNLMIPTCRNHVSKLLQYATATDEGTATVVVVGQVATYMRREREKA